MPAGRRFAGNSASTASTSIPLATSSAVDANASAFGKAAARSWRRSGLGSMSATTSTSGLSTYASAFRSKMRPSPAIAARTGF